MGLRRVWLPWSIAVIVTIIWGWCAAEALAATLSVHPFGRYEFLLQEREPVDVREIVGMVRRNTGLPEYPLMFGIERARLQLNILGPGNRPLRLVSAKGPSTTAASGGLIRFIVERSVMHGEALELHVRQVGSPQRAILRINLTSLARMLEGER